ncbi:MAG: 3'-5' exonuclease, partial [bacterium]|nr:3'-5' exonuclease [bacterium]
ERDCRALQAILSQPRATTPEPEPIPEPIPEPEPATAETELPAEVAPPPGVPVLVAFDFETTGLSPEQANIIEVGAIKFTLSGEELGRLQKFANPGETIPPVVVELTGISDDMVADAAPSVNVMAEFLDWAGPDAILVAHNAAFDCGFIVATLNRTGVDVPPLKTVDTLKWARAMKLGLKDCKLGTLLEHYGKNDGGLHRSMADAVGVMELVLQFTTGHLDPMGLVDERITPIDEQVRSNGRRS